MAEISSAVAARSVRDLVEIPTSLGATPFRFFWGHRPRADGLLGPSCLSQWWPSTFAAEGQVFATAEHYMMWRKARLFDDLAAAQLILDAPGPGEAKKAGRGVRGFDATTWDRHRWGVVVTGSVLKFSADLELAHYLISTGDDVLVEASPDDSVWGIGLAADHPDAARPERWPGLNLLGFALMEARQQLRDGGTSADGRSAPGPG